jgi:hypothetical protein
MAHLTALYGSGTEVEKNGNGSNFKHGKLNFKKCKGMY